MGYAFTMDEPSDDMDTPCAFNNHQMNYVRLVMLEVGVIDGDGYRAANRPDAPVCDQTMPARLFDGIGAHISAAQAAFIAGRLGPDRPEYVIDDLLSFFDDHPGITAVQSWVNEFAAFNAQAAQRDGYHVV